MIPWHPDGKTLHAGRNLSKQFHDLHSIQIIFIIITVVQQAQVKLVDVVANAEYLG